MLQSRSTVKLDDIESVLKAVAHRHNANVTVVSHLGQPHQVEAAEGPREALVFTFYHPKLHTALLAADIRFAGFLPCRVAAWPEADGVMLQALAPSEFCRILGRSDLEPLTVPGGGGLWSVAGPGGGPRGMIPGPPPPAPAGAAGGRAPELKRPAGAPPR